MPKHYRQYIRKNLLKILLFHTALIFSIGLLVLPSPVVAHPAEAEPTRELRPGETIFHEPVPSTMMPDIAYTIRSAYVGEAMVLEYPTNLTRTKKTLITKYRGMSSAHSFAIAENPDHPFSGSLYLPALPGPVQFKLGRTIIHLMVVEVTPERIRYYRFF